VSSSTQDAIAAAAQEVGFDLVGFARPKPDARAAEAYRRWLEAGMAAGMAYMGRPDRVDRTLDPRLTLPTVRSVVVVGVSYAGSWGAAPRVGDEAPQVGDAALRIGNGPTQDSDQRLSSPTPAERGLESRAAQPHCDPSTLGDPSRGRFAMYSWGLDYHDAMLQRLERLARRIAEIIDAPIAYRAYVDTGPLLERDLARRAGLGFIGRNTMLIRPGLGSHLFLGEILVDAEIEPDERPLGGTCGSCTRCLDACPTGALVEPYVLDARRCISYLTIENKGPIPEDLRPLMGNWVFGCDVCNDVCPYNVRLAPSGTESGAARPPRSESAATGSGGSSARAHHTRPWVGLDRAAPLLLDLLALDDDAFRERFAGTPVERTKRRGLLRNVCVAIGNWGSPEAMPALEAARDDHEELIREHAAWALERIRRRASTTS